MLSPQAEWNLKASLDFSDIIQSHRDTHSSWTDCLPALIWWPLWTHLIEMIPYNLPYPGPLQPDTTHVVVWYLHNLLQTEHSRVCRRGQFVHRYSTQPSYKIHCETQHRSTRCHLNLLWCDRAGHGFKSQRGKKKLCNIHYRSKV